VRAARAIACAGVLVLLAGCGSAGGTAGIFDVGSVWYKHPTTGDVKECGGGFYPGVQIRRYNCGKRRLDEGYAEVEKCKVAQPGALCVTDAEIERAERLERSGATASDRLQELKKAHEQGLITDQEYETKRRQIVDGI
jgi:hypothetical protein